MHANAITYDARRDLIFISVNFYHEIWVIDHSTTSEEASGSSGGNYGTWGRFGLSIWKPATYDGLGTSFLDNAPSQFLQR